MIHKIKHNPVIRFIPDLLGITNGSKYKKIASLDEKYNPEIYQTINKILAKFHQGEGFAPPLQRYKLAQLSRLLKHYNPSSILELGSGSSTGILGDYSREFGAQVISVEENLHWVNNTISVLTALNCEEYVKVIHCDARVSEDYLTAEYLDLPYKNCDFLIVDGPSLTKNGYTRRHAVCMDATRINAKVIVVDMRKATVDYLAKHMKATYEHIPSDVLLGNPNSELRYWSIFVKR